MEFTVSLLLSTFLLSVAALFAFIWSMSKGLFGDGTAAATQIFAPNELGTVEDPAATSAQKGGLQQALGMAAGSGRGRAAAEGGAPARAHPPPPSVGGGRLPLGHGRL